MTNEVRKAGDEAEHEAALAELSWYRESGSGRSIGVFDGRVGDQFATVEEAIVRLGLRCSSSELEAALNSRPDVLVLDEAHPKFPFSVRLDWEEGSTAATGYWIDHELGQQGELEIDLELPTGATKEEILREAFELAEWNYEVAEQLEDGSGDDEDSDDEDSDDQDSDDEDSDDEA